MENTMEQLVLLLRAKAKCIWIKTYEEQKVINDIKRLMLETEDIPSKLYTWSYFSGLQKEALTRHEKKEEPQRGFGPDMLLDEIDRAQLGTRDRTLSKDENIWIIKDFHLINNEKSLIRGIRDVKERNSKEMQNYNPIIVISPVVNIPLEHEKLFTIIDYALPTKEDIRKLFNNFILKMEQKNKDPKNTKQYIIPTEESLTNCINLAYGLTLEELKEYCARSLISKKTISEEMFYQARLDLIKKTGILEYKVCNSTLDDMGGNHAFKAWIDDIKECFSPEAEAFGVEKPKGFLGLGIPGTSKTLSAEIISSELKLPLLKFNMSSVMHSHVGQSEKNMENAINIVKSCSPCVLLIDEAEKTLSGTGSSNKTDGGTLMRVVGQLLEFLGGEASKDVFTIMTSNDVSQLPPELTRSGRLDTLWYFGLPTEEERREIFRIHLDKSKISYAEELPTYASKISENLTGAEIKEMVKVAVRKAFRRYKQDGNASITEEDLEKALPEIIPVYESSKEKILFLEEYAKNRARFANDESSENCTLSDIDEDDDDTFNIKI